MRLIRENSPIPRLLAFPLLTLALFGIFWLRFRPGLVLQLAHCPLKDSTGIPCPTCGGTHAAAALAGGDLPAALAANPLVALVGVGFLLWAIWAISATLFAALRYSVELTSREKRAAKVVAALLFLFAWAGQITSAVG